MQQSIETQKEILRDLGDGLVLRRATSADAESLAEFNARIHSDKGPDDPDLRVGVWTRDLLTRPHPTLQPGDFTIVESINSGEIVSSLNLIPQTWAYGDIEFGVGRPELVGTLPKYRNRGLVRVQFDEIHRWSAERGHLVQAITGIPYYYRQFGYEMAINLGGGRAGFKALVPTLREGEAEPYHLRPAGQADLPFIAQLYEQGSRRSLVRCIYDQDLWLYELVGKSKDNVNRSELRMIETPDGEAVGFLAHSSFMWGAMLAANIYELKPGISWAAVTPSVIRYLEAEAITITARTPGSQPFDAFGFWLGAEHPVYQVLHNRLPRVRKPYAWYIRVPDLPGFLRHIAPVLEKRLAESPVVGYSGELLITFYRSGLRLILEKGRLAQIETWRPEPKGDSGQAGFPDLTYLQLLFGFRSLEELANAFPDCWTSTDDAWALLNAMFPKQASDIWPVS